MNKEADTKDQTQLTKEDLEKEKLTFLYKAIKDAQETIRLADEKTSIILLLLIIFISIMGTHIHDVTKYFWYMPAQVQAIFVAIAFLFIIVIVSTIILMIHVIFPKRNPVEHISMQYKPKGFFYLSDLNISWKDYFIFRKNLILKPSLEEYLQKYEAIEDTHTLQKELIYELLKVSFIREMKIRTIANLRMWIFSAIILSLILAWLHFIGLSYYAPEAERSAAHLPEFLLHFI